MDSTAIDRIAQLAAEAANSNRLDTHTPSIVLRDEDGQQRVVSLEPFAAYRSRFRGTYSTNSLQDFARYIIAHPGGEGFILSDKLAATVIFNLHADVNVAGALPAAPVAGHADHRAELALKPTPDFAAMQAAANTRFEQRAFIEWLEDWAYYLQPDQAESTASTGGMNQAINALRKVKVKATAEAVHTNKDFGASRSALEDVEASSDIGLPSGFYFTCQPSEDLDSRVFYLRLGVLTGGEKPVFVLRWSKREADIEAIGQNFKAKLLDAIGDKATMLLGSFDAGR